MDQSIPTHVGSRIRLYRKMRRISLQTLAEQVHKSKASISKYEAGQIAIDVVTLFDIALALNVAPSDLMDCAPAKSKAPACTPGPFSNADKFYLYHAYKGEIKFSIAHLNRTKQTENGTACKATLFYKLEDPEKPESCDCVYRGHMHSYETVLNFVLQNHHNMVEHILLNFFIPMRNASNLVGMISGIGYNNMIPTAHKILLSRERLPFDEKLKESLLIGPEAFKDMRRRNMLCIPLD